MLVGEAIGVDGIKDEAEGESVPEVKYAALVALVRQFLQVLIAEETGEFVVAAVLFEVLLEVSIRREVLNS